MAIDCEATDFEWMDPIAHSLLIEDVRSEESSHFVKEGYLHVMEKLSYDTDGAMSTLSRAMKRVRTMSDPAILGSWSRRWCVLSQTPDGIHLLLYKDQSSYLNLQSPCSVLPLDNCLRLSSLPSHNKSENTFSITLERRDILFYTDKSSESEEWLKVLEDTLHLQDAYCHSPLKGLPQQKAQRKDSQSSLHGAQSPTRQTSNPDKDLLPPLARPSSRIAREIKHVTSSAAVSKGILATSAALTDHSATMKRERPKSKSTIIKRTPSLSTIGRKMSEPVQVLQVKKLNT